MNRNFLPSSETGRIPTIMRTWGLKPLCDWCPVLSYLRQSYRQLMEQQCTQQPQSHRVFGTTQQSYIYQCSSWNNPFNQKSKHWRCINGIIKIVGRIFTIPLFEKEYLSYCLEWQFRTPT